MEHPTQYFDASYLEKTYDKFAAEYDSKRGIFDNIQQLEKLNQLIPKHANILDVGCGSGIPVIQYFLKKGHHVIGTDISGEMLKLAKKNVPAASELIKKDMVDLDFESDSFDLITSFYALFHTSSDKHEVIFKNFYRMLKKNGYAYFTLAGKEYTGQQEYKGTKNFSGVSLPYSHYSVEQYKKILTMTKFEICDMQNKTIGGETMNWVLVRKI